MDEALGPVAGRHKKFLMALEMVSVERVLPSIDQRQLFFWSATIKIL